ncbi:MAG: TAXI family TRAP transporter solute-binding subunit [Planctomycetota bacterium]|jgi:TRAP transporter TAXI family solute receptor
MRKTIIVFIALAFGFALVLGCGPGEEENVETLPKSKTPLQTETPVKTEAPAKAELRIVKIGTSSSNEVYYFTGDAIASFVNKKEDMYSIRCKVASTDGSVNNVNALMAGELEFGIVRADQQYQAINGLTEWRDKGPQSDLRAVFSVHPESISLVAAVDAGIHSIKDLKGKRVNIGNPGSGQRQNSIDALEAVGINFNRDLMVKSTKASDAPGLLQDGQIDAFFYTAGHPSGAIKEATAGARKVRFVIITGIETLVSKYPYYARAKIPVELYPDAKNTKDVNTFGVRATIVTSAKISDDVVYAITKEVFDNFEDFKKLYPASTVLTKEDMLAGLSAQIHPGAMRYYKEAGLK